MQNNLKNFIGLLIILIVVSYLVLSKNITQEHTNQLLIPALKDQVNDIDEIYISKNEQSLSFRKENESWVLQEANSYFADVNKIASLIMDLRNLKLRSKKTSKPEKYKNLSLAQTGEHAAIHLILNKKAEKVADVFIGKKATKTNATYVRKNSEKQTWLASGSVAIDLDSSNWIVKTILNISAEQIMSVKFDLQKQKPYKVSKLTPKDAEFILSEIPSDMQVKLASDIQNLANGLINLSIDNPQRMSKNFDAKLISINTYTLFSGKIYQLNVYKKEDKNYLSVQLAENHDYTDFEMKLVDWVFEIPSFKFQALTKNLDDLIEAKVIDTSSVEAGL